MTNENPPELLDTAIELCYNCHSAPTSRIHRPTLDASLSCPVCGVSINPQPTIREAIQTWNQKQLYLRDRDACERESPDGLNPVFIGYCLVSQEF